MWVFFRQLEAVSYCSENGMAFIKNGTNAEIRIAQDVARNLPVSDHLGITAEKVPARQRLSRSLLDVATFRAGLKDSRQDGELGLPSQRFGSNARTIEAQFEAFWVPGRGIRNGAQWRSIISFFERGSPICRGNAFRR